MALVVLLRGVNVGGHRRFRPTELVRELSHLEATSLGAAGTFVVRRPISQAALRKEFAQRLPFETEIVICRGIELLRLVHSEPFAAEPDRSDRTQFVSVLARSATKSPELPLGLPSLRSWQLRILGREGRFVLGVYRRQMKAISLLGEVDRLFGAAATTRSWNTIRSIAARLSD